VGAIVSNLLPPSQWTQKLNFPVMKVRLIINLVGMQLRPFSPFEWV